MTYAVTILADHKGVARPSVFGDEYVVDALLDITSYGSTAITVTGDFDHNANAFSYDSGGDLTTLTVGQQVTISNSAGSNDGVVSVLNVDAATMQLSAVASTNNNDEVAFTNTNEILSAGDFGLSTITQLVVTGKEDKTYDFFPRVESDGTYLTSSKVELKAVTAASSAEVATTTNVGSMRIRVYGQL
tara:strand:- start:1129 stop:1692 length:564 start_codon:yes stop_codon:yes gene_type:complete